LDEGGKRLAGRLIENQKGNHAFTLNVIPRKEAERAKLRKSNTESDGKRLRAVYQRTRREIQKKGPIRMESDSTFLNYVEKDRGKKKGSKGKEAGHIERKKRSFNNTRGGER